MDSAQNPKGLFIFAMSPTIRGLGRERLQQLGDEWAATAEAKDLGVAGVDVGEPEFGFPVLPRWAGDGARPVEHATHRFVKALTAYVVEHGLSPDQQEIGRRILEVAAQGPLSIAGMLKATPPAAKWPTAAGRGPQAAPEQGGLTRAIVDEWAQKVDALRATESRQ